MKEQERTVAGVRCTGPRLLAADARARTFARWLAILRRRLRMLVRRLVLGRVDPLVLFEVLRTLKRLGADLVVRREKGAREGGRISRRYGTSAVAIRREHPVEEQRDVRDRREA